MDYLKIEMPEGDVSVGNLAPVIAKPSDLFPILLLVL